MGCFNDPAWKVCGWVGWVGHIPSTYIQLAGAGSINKNKNPHPIIYKTLLISRETSWVDDGFVFTICLHNNEHE